METNTYTDTLFGIQWRTSISSSEVMYILLTLAVIIIIIILIKYNLKRKEALAKAKLLFEFKIKQYGLTGLQIKILNHIVELLKLKNPQTILNSPGLFESTMGEMLNYLKDCSEEGTHLADVCKDIIITYEKLYHYTKIRKPIEKISDIEEGVLFYFYKDTSVVYVGKLVRNQDPEMVFRLFRGKKEVPEIEVNKVYSFYLWRSGDAEYIFSATVVSFEDNNLTIRTPKEFTRGREVRRPYVDVIIPATIVISDELYREVEAPEQMSATIIKLNEHEIVFRKDQKLDYKYKYMLKFKLDDYKVEALIAIIADKTITEGNIHYHTCKIIEISEAAKAILRKFITDRF